MSEYCAPTAFLMRPAAAETFRQMLRRCRRQYPSVHLAFVRDCRKDVVLLAHNQHAVVAYDCAGTPSRVWLLWFELDARSGAFEPDAKCPCPQTAASFLLGKRLY